MADDDRRRDDEQQPEERQTPSRRPAAEEPASAEERRRREPTADEPAAEPRQAPGRGARRRGAGRGARRRGRGRRGRDVEETPRVKPAIPGADLEVDLVFEGSEARRSRVRRGRRRRGVAAGDVDEDLVEDTPIATATIDLAAGARYRATGKRKTAVARVILKPGTGAYSINGKPLDDFFPRSTLQRNIRQPLETVGYEDRMDVVARMHGGGVSAQAGALRHGISRALLEADPNLRGELKKRGFLTRDARVKERKKAGLKKARKRPQFSKR